MSDSKKATSTITKWDEGLAVSQADGATAKFAEANRHCAEGDASLLRAGKELRIALNTYLKGDKARFALACDALFNRSVSAAYEYVQAYDASQHFSKAVQSSGVDPTTVGVRTWAKLDRFTTDDDAKAEGLKVIRAEVSRAKAEGTKAFTNEGLKQSIRTVKGEPADETGTDDDRKVSRIAGKYRDDLRSAFVKAEAVRTEHGARLAFIAAVKLGAKWGAISGALTETAIASLSLEWSAELKAIEAEAKAAQRKADRLASAAKAIKPDPTPKPDATVKPVTKAKPKRSATAFKPATETQEQANKRRTKAAA